MANDLDAIFVAGGRLRRTDYVYEIRILGTWNSNEEVIGLDIPVDEGLLMDCLYTGNLLIVFVSKGRLSIMHTPSGNNGASVFVRKCGNKERF